MLLRLLTLVLLQVQSSQVTAFQILGRQTFQCHDGKQRFTLLSTVRHPFRLEASDSFVDVEEYVTPNQIKDLRKEVSKRRKRSELVKYHIPENESHGDFTEESVVELLGLLKTSELVEVRGINRDDRRGVFATAEDLTMTLSELGTFITLIEKKGFAAVLYRPGDDDVENKIVRRTSHKEGQWTRKKKAKRDNRGQIIKGEYEYFF